MVNKSIGLNPERYGLIVPEALLAEYKQTCHEEGSTPPVELRKAMQQYVNKVKARRLREAQEKERRTSERVEFLPVTEISPAVLAMAEKVLADIETKQSKDTK